MKNVLKIALFTIMTVFMVNCSTDDSVGGDIPENGWRLGSTNYTSSITQRNSIGGSVQNSLIAIDITDGVTNLHTAFVIFNETTGIAAGTYKIKEELTGELPAADEIIISGGTDYDNNTGVYASTYYAVPGQNVMATVTITAGKAKIVIPQVNVAKSPYSPTSEVTTFAGTLIEQ